MELSHDNITLPPIGVKPQLSDSKLTSSQSKLKSQTLEHSVRDSDENDMWLQIRDIKSVIGESVKERNYLNDAMNVIATRLEKLERALNSQSKFSGQYSDNDLNKRVSGNSILENGIELSESSLNENIKRLQENIFKLGESQDLAKQTNNRITSVLSETLAQQSKDLNELKSILSAEITARRKYQAKTNQLIERFVAENEREMYSMRKDILHLTESFGSRIISMESSSAIHRETLIHQIADTRNIMTDNLNNMKTMIETMRGELNSQLSNDQQMNSKFREMQEKLNDIPSIIQQKYDMLIKDALKQVDVVRQQCNNLQEQVENMNRLFIRSPQIKSTIDENKLSILIDERLKDQENKLKSALQQILKDVSEEITDSAYHESLSRSQQISNMEEKIYLFIQKRSEDLLSHLNHIESNPNDSSRHSKTVSGGGNDRKEFENVTRDEIDAIKETLLNDIKSSTDRFQFNDSRRQSYYTQYHDEQSKDDEEFQHSVHSTNDVPNGPVIFQSTAPDSLWINKSMNLDELEEDISVNQTIQRIVDILANESLEASFDGVLEQSDRADPTINSQNINLTESEGVDPLLVERPSMDMKDNNEIVVSNSIPENGPASDAVPIFAVDNSGMSLDDDAIPIDMRVIESSPNQNISSSMNNSFPNQTNNSSALHIQHSDGDPPLDDHNNINNKDSNDNFQTKSHDIHDILSNVEETSKQFVSQAIDDVLRNVPNHLI